MHKLLAITATTLMSLAACSRPGEQTSACASISPQGWPYSQPVTLTGADTVPSGAALWLRHTESYPYSNLWLELSRTLPDSTTRRDTLQITLCDPYGRWLGSGIGPSRQVSVELRDMPAFDTAAVTVRHIMRLDTLHGIEQVGISYSLMRR